MKEDDKITNIQKKLSYLSEQFEQSTKDLLRLDLKNLNLTLQKKQALTAFNFIKIIQEKIENVFTREDLYSNIVKTLTSDLYVDSSALLRIEHKSLEIIFLALEGLHENRKVLKLDKHLHRMNF